MSQKLRQHLETIIDLTDEEFDYILSHFTYRKFLKNQYVIQEGDYVKYDYFVLSGLLKSWQIDDKGSIHIVLFATENWWISDPEAFHYQTKATLNIDCFEDSETLFISQENREKLCAEMQKMQYFFRKKTTAGYVASQKRILSLISFNAKQRYEYFTQQYPDLLQRVPKTLIASYLGITRETLSRLISLQP
ncbi:Crp/Fnr family transcriptional regulator [Pseudoflavitalea sp. G-6-1-2]|uniref:Crp/Fnr family transcriptional regulator n=1 Tax=Pseudoflavitalea sp. G-6-1-2 TaxID=2728841 RepID=UPI00146F4A70|nr:Crp/Fnr family transcriptional regulator [Pseudoflavitalea sp. G-6-1-2]NML19414.1 Crp/Fnr family transcriptional regulator [Pseudoflavitalea sp. G-6-1-2]